MGNCIVMQKQVIKIIKTDGGILEYEAPMKVHQVLSKHGGHALSDTLPVVQHLHPDADMIDGRLYYLLPLPVAPSQAGKKKVRFSDPVVAAGQATGVVRIKLIISKQELQTMLQKGGLTIDDMVSKHQKEENMDGTHCKINRTGRQPVLESIPEGN